MRRTIAVSSTRLPLTDNDWIDVKDELTVADRRAILRATFSGVDAAAAPGTPERYHFDVTGRALATIDAYLLAWSLTDAAGKPIDIATPTARRHALESVINEFTFNEIRAAIDAHIDAAGKAPAEVTPATAPISA